MPERPKVGIASIVIKDNKVLMGIRKNALGEGTWHFPGGHLEYGESWEECASRETMEEANISIKNSKFLTITNDVFTKESKHYVTIFIKSDYASGELKVMEPEKCEKWEWFDTKSLPAPVFKPIENLLKTGFKF